MSRTCLLTGSAGLLGEAFCERYAAELDIAALYRTEPPLVPSQDRWLVDPVAPRQVVPESAHPVYAVRADLLDPIAAERAVELVLAHFGHVDLLVNAAADLGFSGVVDPRLTAAWQDQLAVNAVVPARLAALLADRAWRSDERANRRRRRNVVNVSSTSGLGQAPGRGRGFYGASKAALNTLTRAMAAEYHPLGIRVNAVAPGNLGDRIPVEWVLDAIRELDAGQMTGQILVLDADGAHWA
jgi:NAD(P)-dependent dehydrogenase (short-subunit alcohol dehydrogenase family)